MSLTGFAQLHAIFQFQTNDNWFSLKQLFSSAKHNFQLKTHVQAGNHYNYSKNEICTESTEFCEKYTVSSRTQQGLHENLKNREIDSLSTPAYPLRLSLDPQDSPEDPPGEPRRHSRWLATSKAGADNTASSRLGPAAYNFGLRPPRWNQKLAGVQDQCIQTARQTNNQLVL